VNRPVSIRWRLATLGLLLLPLAHGCDSLPGKPNPADAPKRPEQITDFRTLFGQNCAGCHGAEGKLGPAPPLNDPVFLAIVPDEALKDVIARGRPNTPMPPFARAHGGTLTDQQVEIIAKGIKPRWQASSVKSEDYPPYVLPAGVAGNPAEGEKTFKTACASCHGEQGQGSKTVDRTIGAINNWPYLALSSDQVLRRYIITGRPDLGMPSCIDATGRPSDFKPLTSNEVTALTNLLIEWREKSAMGR